CRCSKQNVGVVATVDIAKRDGACCGLPPMEAPSRPGKETGAGGARPAKLVDHPNISQREICFRKEPTRKSAIDGLCGEKPIDENRGVARILFREEVTALHRLSMRAWSPL